MGLIFSDLAKKIILLCLGVFLFLLFFHRGIETEDVWLHLSTGQWIVHHGQLPYNDKFPFAQENTPYLCHEWLASSLLYLTFKTVGFTGLKLFRSIFFILSIGIFFIYAYRRLPFSLLVFLTVLMAYALFQRCLLRPDSVNLIFVQVFLISLFSYERNGGRWKLFLLPLIGIFWYNLHMMGAFIYGGSIIFVFLISALIRRAAVKGLALTFVVFLILFILNPYGVDGLLFPYKVILFPKYYGFYKMVNITAELQNSAYIFLSFDYFYYILLMIIPFVFLSQSKKLDPTLNLLFTIALFAFLYMTRNSSFFTLVAVYTIVHAAGNIDFLSQWARARWSAWLDTSLLLGVTFFLIIQSFNFLNETVYSNGSKQRVLYLETNPYVTSTFDFLNENKILGPVFNGTLLGGPMIWFDYPQLRPFDDGRHLDYQRYSDETNVLLNPIDNWGKTQEKYGFKIVILSEGFNLEENVINYLHAQKDWQLIAIKGPIVIFVKKGEFHLSNELDTFERRLGAVVLTKMETNQLRMMVSGKSRSMLEKFLNPDPLMVDTFPQGVTLMNLSYKGAAAKCFMEALKISDQDYIHETVNIFLKQLN